MVLQDMAYHEHPAVPACYADKLLSLCNRQGQRLLDKYVFARKQCFADKLKMSGCRGGYRNRLYLRGFKDFSD